MTSVSPGISDFKLTTLSGQLISDRVCCHDDIVASWTVVCDAATCSDNSDVGYIQLKNPCVTSITHPLKKDTSNYTFSFNECCTGSGTLTFSRQCSDCSDFFTRNLTFFETKVDAGSDKSILFGEKITLGNGSPDVKTTYTWCGANISDPNSLNTTARPCRSGTYTVSAHDNEFSECSDMDSVNITVATPTIAWSDVQQSDGGSTCTFTGTLISSDTYTNQFHITLKNGLGSDMSDYYASTPHSFVTTVEKPLTPGTDTYTLTATLSDCVGCPSATVSNIFSCTKPSITLPGGPSTFEMFIRLFGFLFLFILLGLILSGNQ